MPKEDTPPVSKEVRDFLSRNGKVGGQTTKRLIELGKRAAEESGTNVQSEVEREINRSKQIRAQRPH